ncbi:AraC family transcriptional regulator [Dyadobacter sp. LHD-138]|uniref:helix-turn-helix domain-containing protein n=1 Tax=Dyadobacter sp. LHD-138 TaxID=3071413 RepID=UPI0027E18F13|nr:AraC family transcriptional regulator [Dyadobacter sp. LHD-138]MDQ6480521.1 AraC family transcriptional regulator [Dyadobacter sp. LHD-138]
MIISLSNPGSDSGNLRIGAIRFFNGFDPSGHFSHSHSQVELVCVQEGQTSILVGGHVEQITAGDIFLVGSGLPHSIHTVSSVETRVAIVHFDKIFLDGLITIIKDFQLTGHLAYLCSQGTLWRNQTEGLVPEILKLKDTEGMNIVILLVQILSGLLGQRKYQTLSQSRPKLVPVLDVNEDKIRVVLDYTQQHYRETITLPQIAAVINFTETSFCRYFKKWTGKSYYHYLNEVRIDKACALLMEDSSKTIEEVCYSIGYSSPSTFYKHFKKVLNMAPGNYLEKIKSYKQQNNIS